MARTCVAALLFLLVTELIAVAPLQAQNKDRDVQALLANDAAVAALRHKYAAQQLTRVEYSKQAQDLAVARRAILARYDRNGQRELTALYRAAAQRAAADARAQAVADAQAKREADQAAARQAANNAADTLAKSVEDDAQEYTRILIRRDELLHRHNTQKTAKKLTDAERQEIAQLRTQGVEIKQKYAPGGPSQRQSAAFEKRLAELNVEKVAPAKQTWLAGSFPDAYAIYAAYSEDSQRLAALSLIDRLLWEQAGQPQVPATAEKIAGYRALMDKLNPKGGPRRVELTNEVYKLTHSNQFKYEVMSKFAPEYAGAALQDLKESQFKERKESESQKSNLILVSMGLIMMALPVVYLIKGERQLKGNRERKPDPNYPFQLPENLSVIKVFRKWIRLDFDCGLVYEKSSWTETVTTNYYRPGSSYEINGTLYSEPGTWGSNTYSTTYYKYSYRTPDGRQSWAHFTGNSFPADEGEIMSVVEFGEHLLFAYNHSRGSFVKLPFGIAPALAMESRLVWFACLAVALVGAALLYFVVLPGTLSAGLADKAVFAVPIVYGIFSGIYVFGWKLFVTIIRRSTFRLKWQPKFREFMMQRTPLLEKVYSSADRAHPRISRAE